MQKIDTEKLAEGIKSLVKDKATLKQVKGVTNGELEAVYSLAFGYYRTGKYDEALKLFQFLKLCQFLCREISVLMMSSLKCQLRYGIFLNLLLVTFINDDSDILLEYAYGMNHAFISLGSSYRISG